MLARGYEQRRIRLHCGAETDEDERETLRAFVAERFQIAASRIELAGPLSGASGTWFLAFGGAN